MILISWAFFFDKQIPIETTQNIKKDNVRLSGIQREGARAPLCCDTLYYVFDLYFDVLFGSRALIYPLLPRSLWLKLRGAWMRLPRRIRCPFSKIKMRKVNF